MHIEKIEHHIKHLEDLHWRLNKDIDLMERHGKFTDFELENMKKERLKLKDEIQSMKKRMEG